MTKLWLSTTAFEKTESAFDLTLRCHFPVRQGVSLELDQPVNRLATTVLQMGDSKLTCLWGRRNRPSLSLVRVEPTQEVGACNLAGQDPQDQVMGDHSI